MDDEIAAKHVLLDFELVTLIALAMGVFAYALVRRVKRHRSGLEDPPRDFDGFDLILMFFPAMLFLINPIAEVLVLGDGKEVEEAATTEDANGIFAIVMNLGYFGFVGIMTYGLIAWVRNRDVSRLFGLRQLRVANIIVLSIIGGIFSLLLCGWIVGDFANRYLESLFGELDLQEPVKMLRESESSVHLILAVVMACVAAPIVEEMLFRGYMYGTLRELTHPVFSAVIIGGLFAVVHGNLPALLPLWVFSLLLSFAYEATRCLWVPIGMHAFFNAANIVLMMTDPGE
ncbi:MAG: CPBP family intramembrane metalloprotease [Verrucomicrobiales bacterium]|nr:CPBP family intramembrane metalloprotease [Verrucomicrobiales bacterium]